MKWEYGQVIAGPADFSPRHVPLRELALPSPGAIHLWFIDLDEMAGALEEALADPGEAARNKPFTGGQLTFTRRFYLRLLLGAYLGLPGKEIRIVRNRKGKPVLDPAVHGRELHFSIAKSGSGFLVGLSSSSYLGVDIEPCGRRANNALGVARRYFSPAEAAALEAMEPEDMYRAFLRTWSCKEAVVKALGLGIANQLCRFTVETDPGRPAAVLEFENDRPEAWWLQMVRPQASFLGAVATRSEPLSLSAFRMRPAATRF
ncbi:MAG: 4'-phosphopantetheinyl transferase superfamily protein [Xanthomonadales bacterium]|jgi:4'-phosphopantetheinyl transferase|nr:4'-phosphopantetheinyl transferase superfamily protein [Xanthomonadales bacterium]